MAISPANPLLRRYFTPVAFATITWKTYVLFAVFCAAMFIHCFFLFPETANKPLEEIAAIFEDSGPGSIRYIGTPAWKTCNDRHTALHLERNVVDPGNKSADIRSSDEANSKDESKASV